MLLTLLVVFGISMVPIIELRGAIPIGIAMLGLGSDVITALQNRPDEVLLVFLVAVIGNMLPVPFIYLFARKVLEWGKDKKFIGRFFTWILNKGEKAGNKINGKKGAIIGLMLFVGIPLPGTGAWTGTLAASILHLKFKDSMLAAIGGVLLAGIIVLTLSLIGVNVFG